MLTWTAPAALWLLAAVPFVWLALAVARTNFNRRQRWLQASAAVADADRAGVPRSPVRCSPPAPRASPSSTRSTCRTASSSTAIEAAAQRIDDLNAALRPVTLPHRRLRRARAAAIDEHRGAAPARPADPRRPVRPRQVDRRGTDLEAALDAARARARARPRSAHRAVHRRPRDGGDSDAAVARLVDSAHSRLGRTAGRRDRSATHGSIDLDMPERDPRAGARFTATVAVGSQRDGQAVVELRSGAQGAGAAQSVAVAKGLTPVAIDAVLDAPGRARARRRRVTMAGRSAAGEQHARAGTLGRPAAEVLYVEGTPASARYLSGALHRRRVRRHACVRPRALPAHAGRARSLRRRRPQRRRRARRSRRRDGRAVRHGWSTRRRAAGRRRRSGVRREGGYRKHADRAADAGDVRAQGRTGGRADPRARSLVEHGRLVDGSLQGGGAGGGRRDDRRAVGRHPHVQRSSSTGTSRCATSARTATTSGRRLRRSSRAAIR